MRKFIVTEEQLRKANLLFFENKTPMLKDGYEGIRIIEYEKEDTRTSEEKEKDYQEMMKEISSINGY